MGYIYLATNNINGKQYVGQTKYDIKTRWIQHKCEAKRLIPNVYFVRALHKYGIENFSVQELEQCDDNKLSEREKYYIDLYDTYKNGYNSTLGGEGSHKFETQDILNLWNEGLAVSEIAKKLNCTTQTVSTNLHINGITISETRSRGQSKLSNSKKITLQYDSTGNLVNIYDSVINAAIAMELGENAIRAACNGRAITVKGYYWRHPENNAILEHIDVSNCIEKTKRPISQYNLSGEFIKNFNSIADAAIELNVHRSSIENALVDKSYNCSGFLWKYQDDEEDIMEKVKRNNSKKDYLKKAIDQYDLNNNYITTFPSAHDAAIALGHETGASSITKVCKGKNKSAYKFIWKYHIEP